MARINWLNPRDMRFSAGVDRGVFYPKDGTPGEAWLGLVNVSIEEDESKLTPIWIDGFVRGYDTAPGQTKGSIEALTYPETFATYAGGELELAPGFHAHNQDRREFDLCYRTLEGDALSGYLSEYRLHLIYNALASMDGRSYGTITDATEPESVSWSLVATPRFDTDSAPTSYFTISTWDVHPYLILQVENILYGVNADEDPSMISPTLAQEILEQEPPEMLRNLARDPSFEGELTGSYGWYSLSASTKYELSNEWAIDGWVSGKVTRISTASNTVGIETTVAPADLDRFMGVRVTAHVDQRLGMSVPVLNVVRGTTNVKVNIPTTHGDHVVQAILDTQSETDQARVRLTLNYSTGIGLVDDEIAFDNVVIVTAETEEELNDKLALLDQLAQMDAMWHGFQSGGFFDGRRDDKKWGYGEWLGKENKSISVYRSFGLPFDTAMRLKGFGLEPFGLTPFGGQS